MRRRQAEKICAKGIAYLGRVTAGGEVVAAAILSVYRDEDYTMLRYAIV